MLAFWMSREGNATSQKMNGNGTVTGISATTRNNQEFQTPSRRPRFVEGNINFFILSCQYTYKTFGDELQLAQQLG